MLQSYANLTGKFPTDGEDVRKVLGNPFARNSLIPAHRFTLATFPGMPHLRILLIGSSFSERTGKHCESSVPCWRKL